MKKYKGKFNKKEKEYFFGNTKGRRVRKHFLGEQVRDHRNKKVVNQDFEKRNTEKWSKNSHRSSTFQAYIGYPLQRLITTGPQLVFTTRHSKHQLETPVPDFNTVPIAMKLQPPLHLNKTHIPFCSAELHQETTICESPEHISWSSLLVANLLLLSQSKTHQTLGYRNLRRKHHHTCHQTFLSVESPSLSEMIRWSNIIVVHNIDHSLP